jgi:hypothetical protein
VRQRIHVLFNQRFEVEHHSRAPLRIGCCPRWLRLKGCINGALKHCRIAQRYLCLNCTIVGIKNVALARRCACTARNKMVNLSHRHSLHSAAPSV